MKYKAKLIECGGGFTGAKHTLTLEVETVEDLRGLSSHLYEEVEIEVADIVEESKRCCPKCKSTRVETTTMGMLRGIDENKANCGGCGWKGIAHEMVAEEDKDETPDNSRTEE